MSEHQLHIPNEAGWPQQPLSAICDLIARGKGPTYVDADGVLAIGQRCVTSEGFNSQLCRPHDPRLMAGHLIPKPGDVLLNSTGTGTIGRSAVFEVEGDFIVDSYVTVLRPRTGLALGKWLSGLLRTGWGQTHLERYCFTGSTNQIELSRRALAETSVPLPSFLEQQWVVRTLDSLDTQIRRTEEIIAKLEKVKEGVLSDLLTRGIDENGELRPPPEEAPELYKDSQLGPISIGWHCERFGDCFERVIDYRGRTPKKIGMSWSDGDILALSANNVKMGRIDPSLESNYGDEKLYNRWMVQGDPKKGDVVLTMEAPLGKVAQIPDNRRYILSQRVVLFRFDSRKILNDFAYWQMRGREFQAGLVRRSSGTTASGIQRAQLVCMPFVRPPIHEQKRIDERLRALTENLWHELRELGKLKTAKAGLTDDLLTGRVRVTPLLEEHAQAAG
jgi:type I restriction enzyme S subunit